MTYSKDNFIFLNAVYNLKNAFLFRGVQMPRNILGEVTDIEIQFLGKRKPKGKIEIRCNEMIILTDITDSTNGVGSVMIFPNECIEVFTTINANQKIRLSFRGTIRQKRGRPVKASPTEYFHRMYELVN